MGHGWGMMDGWGGLRAAAPRVCGGVVGRAARRVAKCKYEGSGRGRGGAGAAALARARVRRLLPARLRRLGAEAGGDDSSGEAEGDARRRQQHRRQQRECVPPVVETVLHGTVVRRAPRAAIASFATALIATAIGWRCCDVTFSTAKVCSGTMAKMRMRCAVHTGKKPANVGSAGGSHHAATFSAPPTAHATAHITAARRGLAPLRSSSQPPATIPVIPDPAIIRPQIISMPETRYVENTAFAPQYARTLR